MNESAALPHRIATKLLVPRVRGGLERPHLVQHLREGRDRKLSLVCAPAGYGKTTLLAQWETADRDTTPFAWLALDEGDSDPIRLWGHLIDALHGVHPAAGTDSLIALGGGPRAIPTTVLPLLLNELRTAPPVVVLLDDWHLVKEPVCDATIAALVEHAPDTVQIVLSSRSEPGLPVARLRAHGDLAELRVNELRLSPDEVAQLVHEVGPDLDPEDIERLGDRTEGWIAGLSLALLAMREREDRRRYVAELADDNRNIVEFLSSDVLAATTPEIRHFLVYSSILDRLSGDLCDTVLARDGSSAMLDAISRENLFLLALDDAREEYRYHHLFATMLRHELRVSDPRAERTLHVRASGWFAAHGEIEPAIKHAIAGRDLARASELVTCSAQAFLTMGRIATVLEWLKALYWPEAKTDRQLAVVRAQALLLAGRSRDEVDEWLTVAESGPDFGPLPNGIASVRSAAAMLRSAYLTRGVAAAESDARLVLELEQPASPWRRPGLVTLGQVLYLQGHPEEARAPLAEARALPGAAGQAPVAALGLSYLSLVELDAGDTTAALRLAHSALSLLAERHLSSGIAAVNPHLAMGCALASGSDLHSAIEHLEVATELSTPAGASFWRVHALVRLASALHRVGRTEDAQQAVAAAQRDLDALPDAGMLTSLLAATSEELSERRRRDSYLGEELSEAEIRVLELLGAGDSLAGVARALYLSPNTVKTHRRSIYRKLGISSREELLAHVATRRAAESAAADVHPG